jgi:hypothetical protein
MKECTHIGRKFSIDGRCIAWTAQVDGSGECGLLTSQDNINGAGWLEIDGQATPVELEPMADGLVIIADNGKEYILTGNSPENFTLCIYGENPWTIIHEASEIKPGIYLGIWASIENAQAVWFMGDHWETSATDGNKAVNPPTHIMPLPPHPNRWRHW